MDPEARQRKFAEKFVGRGAILPPQSETVADLPGLSHLPEHEALDEQRNSDFDY